MFKGPPFMGKGLRSRPDPHPARVPDELSNFAAAMIWAGVFVGALILAALVAWLASA